MRLTEEDIKGTTARTLFSVTKVDNHFKLIAVNADDSIPVSARWRLLLELLDDEVLDQVRSIELTADVLDLHV